MQRFRLAVGAEGAHTATVAELLTRAGWQPTGGLDWDLYWDIRTPDEGVFRSVRAGSRMNMLCGSAALTVKSALHQQLARARERLAISGRQDLVDIEPRTFVMPQDFDAWREAAAWEPDTWWIRKPEASSRGRGITLIDDPGEVTPDAGWIIQEYVRRPHLLDGFKYTLRLYVLLTSVEPCVAWLHDDGFAKLASRPFRHDREGRADRFANLTNPDILRDDPTAPVSSRNLTLAAYRERLRADGVDVERLWARIRRVAAATMLAGREPMRAHAFPRNIRTEGSFELFGLDVTLDEELRPILLECNAAPSLAVEADATTAASRDETAVKRRVIGDLLAVAEILPPEQPPRFAPLVPAADTLDLLPCIDVVRDADVAAWRDRFRRDGGWRPLAALGATHAVVGDRLMLYAFRTGEFVPLNPAASVMWLGLTAGADPDTIGREMQDAIGGDARAEVIDDVWLAMCNWLWMGLLADAETPRASAPPRRPAATPSINWHDDTIIELAGCRCAVRASRELMESLRPALAAPECLQPISEIDGAIEIVRAGERYQVLSDDREVWCAPVALASTVITEAWRVACRAKQAVMMTRAAVEREAGSAVILTSAGDRAREPVLVRLAGADAFELMTADGVVAPLIGIRLAGGERAEAVAASAGFLEWMSADPARVLALGAETSDQFMRAAAGLRYTRRPLASIAHAAPGTR